MDARTISRSRKGTRTRHRNGSHGHRFPASYPSEVNPTIRQ